MLLKQLKGEEQGLMGYISMHFNQIAGCMHSCEETPYKKEDKLRKKNKCTGKKGKINAKGPLTNTRNDSTHKCNSKA